MLIKLGEYLSKEYSAWNLDSGSLAVNRRIASILLKKLCFNFANIKNPSPAQIHSVDVKSFSLSRESVQLCMQNEVSNLMHYLKAGVSRVTLRLNNTPNIVPQVHSAFSYGGSCRERKKKKEKKSQCRVLKPSIKLSNDIVFESLKSVYNCLENMFANTVTRLHKVTFTGAGLISFTKLPFWLQKQWFLGHDGFSWKHFFSRLIRQPYLLCYALKILMLSLDCVG